MNPENALAPGGIKWPLFARLNVNGKDAHEVFRYVRRNSELYVPAKDLVTEIPWNWAKFLLNSSGEVVAYFGPRSNPMEMREAIEKLVAEKD